MNKFQVSGEKGVRLASNLFLPSKMFYGKIRRMYYVVNPDSIICTSDGTFQIPLVYVSYDLEKWHAVNKYSPHNEYMPIACHIQTVLTCNPTLLPCTVNNPHVVYHRELLRTITPKAL